MHILCQYPTPQDLGLSFLNKMNVSIRLRTKLIKTDLSTLTMRSVQKAILYHSHISTEVSRVFREYAPVMNHNFGFFFCGSMKSLWSNSSIMMAHFYDRSIDFLPMIRIAASILSCTFDWHVRTSVGRKSSDVLKRHDIRTRYSQECPCHYAFLAWSSCGRLQVIE